MAKAQDSTQALVVVIKALEGLSDIDRSWVLQAAATRWNSAGSSGLSSFGVGSLDAKLNTGGLLTSRGGDAQQAISKRDIRAFIRIKRPTTDVQRVACLGYFVMQASGQAGFTSKEIGQANIDSGGTKINLPRALDNATRRAKYLASRGGNSKQLTTLGEDVVDALPDQQAVAELEVAAKVRSKSKSKKGSKKKKA